MLEMNIMWEDMKKMINENEELINEIANKLLIEVIFTEKKNFNTKELKDAEMIKHLRKLIEREVKKYEIQKNETEEL